MRVRAAVARSSTWRASASQTQNAVAYDISGACAAVGDLGAEAIAGHARQPGPNGRGGYEELPGREPPATNGRNQVAKIPDGRRASDGMRDGAAVPGPATMDPVLLGGAGGAIRPSGWCDSPHHQQQGPRRSCEECSSRINPCRLQYDSSPADAFGTAFASRNGAILHVRYVPAEAPVGLRRGAEPCRDHWASVATTPGGRCSRRPDANQPT